MDFSKEQLNTLSNRFAREKMQKALQQPREKKPRIHSPHYERADITAVTSGESRNTSLNCTNNIEKAPTKRLFTYVFGNKTYINKSDIEYYEGFIIYYE